MSESCEEILGVKIIFFMLKVPMFYFKHIIDSFAIPTFLIIGFSLVLFIISYSFLSIKDKRMLCLVLGIIIKFYNGNYANAYFTYYCCFSLSYFINKVKVELLS